MVAQIASTLLLFGILVLIVGAIKIWTYCVGRWRLGEPVLPYEPRLQVPWDVADLLVVLLILTAAAGCTMLVLNWVSPRESITDRQQADVEAQTHEESRDDVATSVTAASPASENADKTKNEEQKPPRITAQALPLITLERMFGPLVALLFVKFRSRASWFDFGFSTEQLASDVRLGLLAFVAIGPPVYALQGLLQFVYPGQHPMIEMFVDRPSPLLIGLIAFLVVLVAPISEELIVRVLLQGWLERFEAAHRRKTFLRRLPRGLVPILISSVFFALLHAGNGPDPVPIFFLALGLGYLYQRTHRIWPGVAMHMSLNGSSTVALLLGLAIGEPPV